MSHAMMVTLLTAMVALLLAHLKLALLAVAGPLLPETLALSARVVTTAQEDLQLPVPMASTHRLVVLPSLFASQNFAVTVTGAPTVSRLRAAWDYGWLLEVVPPHHLALTAHQDTPATELV